MRSWPTRSTSSATTSSALEYAALVTHTRSSVPIDAACSCSSMLSYRSGSLVFSRLPARCGSYEGLAEGNGAVELNRDSIIIH